MKNRSTQVPRLFEMVELKEGVKVQFVGVYVLRWSSSWGEPQYGFVEYNPDEDDGYEENEQE